MNKAVLKCIQIKNNVLLFIKVSLKSFFSVKIDYNSISKVIQKLGNLQIISKNNILCKSFIKFIINEIMLYKI